MPDHVAGVVAELIGKLQLPTLYEIEAMRSAEDELNAILATLLPLTRVLPDAHLKKSTSVAVREWLRDLKSIAVDIGAEIDLIMTRHALSLRRLKEINGPTTTTLCHRFPGRSRKTQRLRELGQRLDEADQARKGLGFEEVVLHEHGPFEPICLKCEKVWIRARNRQNRRVG